MRGVCRPPWKRLESLQSRFVCLYVCVCVCVCVCVYVCECVCVCGLNLRRLSPTQDCDSYAECESDLHARLADLRASFLRRNASLSHELCDGLFKQLTTDAAGGVSAAVRSTPEMTASVLVRRATAALTQVAGGYKASAKGPAKFDVFVEGCPDALTAVLGSHADGIDAAHRVAITDLRAQVASSVAKAAEAQAAADIRRSEVWCVIARGRLPASGCRCVLAVGRRPPKWNPVCAGRCRSWRGVARRRRSVCQICSLQRGTRSHA